MEHKTIMQADIIGQRLKLQHLKVVMAVAEWGSMAKAAKHLSISQPVISKVIADLEGMLGVRLFDRNSQGVEPTLYGRALLKRSIAILDDMKTSVDEIRFLAESGTGELHIGSTEPLLAGFGIAVIERLFAQYPRIVFHVVEADSVTLIERGLPDRRIELALVPLLRAPAGQHLETLILFEDHLRVIVGAQSPWAHRRAVKLADLADEPWCMARSPIGSLIEDAFRAGGLKIPRRAVSATTAHLLLQLVETGHFVGHFGDRLLQFFTDRFGVKRLPVHLPVQPFGIGIVTLKDRTISPVAKLFIDCAREVAKPIIKQQSRVVGTRKD
jgi:DNA-binding transcriptional LysR family regulator